MDSPSRAPANGAGADHEYLTASDINGYFHFACQLQLWKSFHEGHKPRTWSHPPPLKKAHMNRGNRWEQHVVERLEAQNLILRFSSRSSLHDQIERDERHHFYIIGSTFKSPDLFHQEYISRNQTPVKFGTFKPDFIEVWKREKDGNQVFEYRIIDAKASYKGMHVTPFADKF
jgi:hypothetical protein